MVAADDAVAAVDGLEQTAHHLAAFGAVGDVEVDPAPLAEALDEACFCEKLQVTADARLALPQDLGQVLDVEFARCQQHQDAQARRLGRGFERGHELGCLQCAGHGWWWTFSCGGRLADAVG